MVTSREEQLSLMHRNWCVTISLEREPVEVDEREQFGRLFPAFPATTARCAFDDFLFHQVCQEIASACLPEDTGGPLSPRHQLLEDLSILSLRLQIKDRELYRHSLHVLDLTRRFLKMLHLPREIAIIIQIAAFFHDVGKIDISHDILQKSAPLTPAEFEEMKQHCTHGERRLAQIRPLQEASCMVYHHHEHWNGQGYPDGLQGQAIPLGSRVIAIADSFTVMAAGRTYQPSRSPAAALAELTRCAGTQFDPLLVDLFSRNIGAPLLQEETTAGAASLTSTVINAQTH